MRRRAYGTGLRALACALLAWHVWLVWHAASYEAADVEWTCDSQGCSSDSFAAGAPLLGIATGAVLGLLATRFLRRAAGGAVAVFCALACIVGWHDAVADGLVGHDSVTAFHLMLPISTHSVSDWLTVLWCVVGVGSVFAWWGAAVSLRRSAALRRLTGRYATAEATLSGWRSVSGKYGEVTVAFEDEKGVAYEVPAVTERIALRRTVRAVYDKQHPADARRIRVAIAPRTLWSRP